MSTPANADAAASASGGGSIESVATDPAAANHPQQDLSQTPALRSPAALGRFLFVAAAGLALDLWSKEEVFHKLRQGARVVLVPHVLEFQTMLNPGALFGIGGGQTTLFLIASVAALALVLWMFAHTPRQRWGLQIALGGILAGALGNMYDRIFVRLAEKPVPVSRNDMRTYVYLEAIEHRDGRTVLEEYPRDTGGRRLETREPVNEVGFVRDFIKIPTKLWGDHDLWPWVFNVADMLLVGGVSILALHLLRERKPPARENADNRAPPGSSTVAGAGAAAGTDNV